MAPTETRRLYYRAALKLLALGLVLFVLQAMVSGFFSHPETDTALPLAISLDGFEPGG